MYIATYVLFILVYVLGFSLLKNNEYINQYINENIGNYSILKNLLILPVELTMLQSVFDGSFSVLHNGGTWFISCLFICYLIYPYLFKIITQNKKIRVKIMILIYLISSYAFLVQWGFKFGSIYGNPFFRFLEFFIGMITASLCMDRINEEIKQIKLIFVFIVFFILVTVITIGVHWFHIYEVGAYNFIAIPVFGMILYLLARIEYKYPLKHFLRGISVLSENTYAFFLAQFFTWQPIKIIDNNTDFFIEGRNLKLFLCSLVICCSVTIFLHYGIEKRMKKILTKRYLIRR